MRIGWSYLVPAFVALVAGVSFITQSALNAQLRVVLQSPVRAGFVSYAGGTIVMALIALAQRESWAYVQDFARSQWLLWTGGVFGSIYVIAAIVLLPRLGAATVFALLISGQMLGSLFFDQFGLFGLTPRPIDMARLIGVLLLIGGVILIRRP